MIVPQALRFLPTLLLSLVAAFGNAAPAAAETIAVIGTGDVGGALGPRLASLGHTVVYGSREPQRTDVEALVRETGPGASAAELAEAAAGAHWVLLAVPWTSVEEVVASLGDLGGKIVIDPTNPRIQAEDGFPDHPFHTSNAERIQTWAPDARVVKAFNAMPAEIMADPDLAGGPITVPIAGDDEAARAAVAALARTLGFQTVEIGPVRYAHVIESLYLLSVNAAILGNPVYMSLRPRPPAP
jgi:NADPH-dependent F420 reductase